MEDDRGLGDIEFLGNLIQALAVDEHQGHSRLGRSQIVKAHQGLPRDLGALLGVDQKQHDSFGLFVR